MLVVNAMLGRVIRNKNPGLPSINEPLDISTGPLSLGQQLGMATLHRRRTMVSC